MKIMDIKETAKYLQLHPMTVYRLVRCGELPHLKVGNRYKFIKEKIDAYLLTQSM